MMRSLNSWKQWKNGIAALLCDGIMIELKQDERLDDLERNGYKIIQNPNKFCFGMDAVLLSGFAHVRKGEKVLDMGTGTGIIPILLEAKTEGEHFTGLEIQEESADMARRSVAYNRLEDRVDIVTGDIKNPEEPKAIARHEVLCTLEELVRETSRLLRPGGRFYLVHRPFRLVEIFQTLTAYKLEPKRMKLVYPFVDKAPNMVMIEAIRGAKSMIKIEEPLIVYKEPGVYHDVIYDIYGY